MRLNNDHIVLSYLRYMNNSIETNWFIAGAEFVSLLCLIHTGIIRAVWTMIVYLLSRYILLIHIYYDCDWHWNGRRIVHYIPDSNVILSGLCPDSLQLNCESDKLRNLTFCATDKTDKIKKLIKKSIEPKKVQKDSYRVQRNVKHTVTHCNYELKPL